MKIKFEDGKMKVEKVKECAQNLMLSSELNLSVLKEARIFHFNSRFCCHLPCVLPFQSNGMVDSNLPLPLWKSRDETREMIKGAWERADVIEVSEQELEFLLDEEYHEKRRNYRPQYYAESYEQTKNRRDYYHYTPEEIKHLWHDKLKFLFVTDGMVWWWEQKMYLLHCLLVIGRVLEMLLWLES